MRAACSAAASAAPALGSPPASHGVTSAPPLGPSPGGQFLDAGRRAGGREAGTERNPSLWGRQGAGRLPPLRAGSCEPAGRGRRKRVGLERARGYSSPGLSQTRADPSSPVPSQETGTYFISLGQVRPRYQPPPSSDPPAPRPLLASTPPTRLGRTRAALPPPLRGKAAAAADTWGPRLGVGAPSQPRERCPTRETHVMKPGEGGQVAASLPGSGQTCLESQGRTRSSNPPTRSHLTQPAASPLLLSSPPHPPTPP